MRAVKITAIKTAYFPDLVAAYANPLPPCPMHPPGDSYISNGCSKPPGLCDNAWRAMQEYVMTLGHGGEAFFDDWMRDPHTAVVCCNDGVRPVSFLLELTDEAPEVERQGAGRPDRPERARLVQTSWEAEAAAAVAAEDTTAGDGGEAR